MKTIEKSPLLKTPNGAELVSQVASIYGTDVTEDITALRQEGREVQTGVGIKTEQANLVSISTSTPLFGGTSDKTTTYFNIKLAELTTRKQIIYTGGSQIVIEFGVNYYPLVSGNTYGLRIAGSNGGSWDLRFPCAITNNLEIYIQLDASTDNYEVIINDIIYTGVTGGMAGNFSDCSSLGYGASGNFNGRIYDYISYNTLETLETCRVKGNINNALIYIPIVEKTGTIIYDISGKDNHGTIVNETNSWTEDENIVGSYTNDNGYTKHIQPYDMPTNGVDLDLLYTGGAYDVEFDLYIPHNSPQISSQYHSLIHAGDVAGPFQGFNIVLILSTGSSSGTLRIFPTDGATVVLDNNIVTNTLYKVNINHSDVGGGNWTQNMTTTPYTTGIPNSGSRTGVEVTTGTFSLNIAKFFNPYNKKELYINNLVFNGIAQTTLMPDYEIIIPKNLTNAYTVLGNKLSEYQGKPQYNAQVINQPCLTSDGTQTLSFTDLTGIDITSYEGTSTAVKSGNTITLTAGTIWNLLLDDGTLLPIQESNGSTCYAVGGTAGNATIINYLDTNWTDNTQDVYTRNALKGYNLVGDVKIPTQENNTYLDVLGATASHPNPGGRKLLEGIDLKLNPSGVPALTAAGIDSSFIINSKYDKIGNILSIDKNSRDISVYNINPELSTGYWDDFLVSTINIINTMTANGSTPTIERQYLIDQLVRDLSGIGDTGTGNIWVELDSLSIMVAADKEQALVNWKTTNIQTFYNDPTGVNFTADDSWLTNVAAESILGTGFIPNIHGVKYTQDSASIGVMANTLTDNKYIAGTADATKRIVFNAGVSGGTATNAINGSFVNGGVGFSSIVNGTLLSIIRSNNLNYNLYTNDTDEGSVTSSSTGVPDTSEVYFGGYGLTGALISNIHLRIMYLGSGEVKNHLVQMKDSFNKYLNNL